MAFDKEKAAEARRRELLLKKEAGEKVADIARSLGINPQTIRLHIEQAKRDEARFAGCDDFVMGISIKIRKHFVNYSICTVEDIRAAMCSGDIFDVLYDGNVGEITRQTMIEILRSLPPTPSR